MEPGSLAFLAISGIFEILLAARLVQSLVEHRHNLCTWCSRVARSVWDISCLAQPSGPEAEEDTIENEVWRQKMQMARRYAEALVAISFVVLVTIQWTLIWDETSWTTVPTSWSLLLGFACLVLIQIHPPLLSASTVHVWYLLGTVIVTFLALKQFTPARHVTSVSMLLGDCRRSCHMM